MARRKKVTQESVKQSALELLDLTLEATKDRFRDAKKNEYPCEAALISASVALMKMVETKTALGEDEQEANMAEQRKQFEATRKARTNAVTENTAANVADLYR